MTREWFDPHGGDHCGCSECDRILSSDEVSAARREGDEATEGRRYELHNELMGLRASLRLRHEWRDPEEMEQQIEMRLRIAYIELALRIIPF